MQATKIALVLPILILGILGADAYPMYFHNRGYANSCTDAPSGPVGGHSTPVQDSSITFEVTQDGQAGPVTSLCPGETYQVTVDFGGSSRAALLTVSSGSLAESNVQSCPNAMTTSGLSRQAALKVKWVLPCTVTGPLMMQVTSGVMSSGALLQNSASYPINALCEATTCQPPAPATAPPPPPPSAATAAPAATQDATPVAATQAASTTAAAVASSPTTPEASTSAAQPVVVATAAGGSVDGQDASGRAGASTPQWGVFADFFARLMARVLECAGGC